MNKFVHYILIAIMFNWNIAVFAEDSGGCKWEVVEETETYIQEKCGDNQARIRTKTPEGLNIVTVEAPKKKKENPIKKFKDKVEEAPKATEKVEKLEKIEKEVIATEDKVKEHIEKKKLADHIRRLPHKRQSYERVANVFYCDTPIG